MVNDGECLFHLLSPILREHKTPQKLGPVPWDLQVSQIIPRRFRIGVHSWIDWVSKWMEGASWSYNQSFRTRWCCWVWCEVFLYVVLFNNCTHVVRWRPKYFSTKLSVRGCRRSHTVAEWFERMTHFMHFMNDRFFVPHFCCQYLSDWWFWNIFYFSHDIGNVIIPTDSYFSRGVGGSTTNQLCRYVLRPWSRRRVAKEKFWKWLWGAKNHGEQWWLLLSIGVGVKIFGIEYWGQPLLQCFLIQPVTNSVDWCHKHQSVKHVQLMLIEVGMSLHLLKRFSNCMIFRWENIVCSQTGVDV